MMVSDPLYTVALSLLSVARISRMMCAGQGKYSYCQPEIGLNPNWLAVSAWEKFSWGIVVFLSFFVVTFAAFGATPAIRADKPGTSALLTNVVNRFDHRRFAFLK
jgi:hypothetical protein